MIKKAKEFTMQFIYIHLNILVYTIYYWYKIKYTKLMIKSLSQINSDWKIVIAFAFLSIKLVVFDSVINKE